MQLDRFKTGVESAHGVCNQRLKLEYDEPLSIVAFNLNLRIYKVEDQGGDVHHRVDARPAGVQPHHARGRPVQVHPIKTRVET